MFPFLHLSHHLLYQPTVVVQMVHPEGLRGLPNPQNLGKIQYFWKMNCQHLIIRRFLIKSRFLDSIENLEALATLSFMSHSNRGERRVLQPPKSHSTQHSHLNCQRDLVIFHRRCIKEPRQNNLNFVLWLFLCQKPDHIPVEKIV